MIGFSAFIIDVPPPANPYVSCLISMRVQFECTLEDTIDASKRLLARSKVLDWRWEGLAYSAGFTWLLVFAVVTYFYQRPEVGAAIGVVLAVLSGVLYPSSHEKAVEKRLGKLCREQCGVGKTFPCEVELTTEGVQVRQMHRQVIYEWPSVEEIQATADSIDIFTRDGGGVVVRNRAFSTVAHRSEFLELARVLCNAARS